MSEHQRGEFRRELLPDWEAYASQHGLELLGRGAERRARCGIHGGQRPDSLCINIAGPYECKACLAGGGDVLAYHRAVHDLTFIEAARELGAWAEAEDSESAHRQAEARRSPVAPRSDASRDEETDQRRKTALAARLWSETKPIEPHTPAWLYLHESRNCPPLQLGSDLRWHADLRLFGFSGPALAGPHVAGHRLPHRPRAALDLARAGRRRLAPHRAPLPGSETGRCSPPVPGRPRDHVRRGRGRHRVVAVSRVRRAANLGRARRPAISPLSPCSTASSR